MTAAMKLRAQRIDVPDELRRLDPLGVTANHEDAFVVGTELEGSSAEQWARRIFEEVPGYLRLVMVVGWSSLTFRLGPRPSTSHIQGWRILATAADSIVLGVDSGVGLTLRLVVWVEPGRVGLATFVRYGRPASRRVWAVARPVHLWGAPVLLNLAAPRRAADQPRRITAEE